MRNPPFKCLFCTNTAGPFERIEHTVPESLGNDDTFLPPGFVCDPCNQYFGAKVEQPILASALFSIERVAASVRTKRGRYPSFTGSDVKFYPSGSWGHLLFVSTRDWPNRTFKGGKGYIFTDQARGLASLMARFMLKMGLEFLVLSEGDDPFAPIYDNARCFARFGKHKRHWEVAYGIYPRRSDLLIERRDEGGTEIHQLYDAELGVMSNGDRIFWFGYINHCFACNLSGPKLDAYLEGFDQLNEFQMKVVRW